MWECVRREHGAHGCDSDHNLLWVDWSFQDATGAFRRNQPPAHRLIWDKKALDDPAVQQRYADVFANEIADWSSAVSIVLSNALFLSLQPACSSGFS